MENLWSMFWILLILIKADKDTSLWSVDDVVIWLKSIGFDRYGRNFKENDITGKHLLELTKADLQHDLNIASLGHRMDIIKMIDQLKQSTLYWR
jgi:hypothetical protein